MPDSLLKSKDPRSAGHDIWVLAGQSNMQGCAWLDGALVPDPRVWSFSSAGTWGIAEEPLHRLWESCTPVHQELMRPTLLEEDRNASNLELAQSEDESRMTGAGLGIAFGSAMADQLGKPIGLIPAAHGGTSLDQWSPALKHLGGSSLYGAMLERITNAGGNLRGILWYQGESDGITHDTGRTYAERMDAWIHAVRTDTGIADLPVAAVQIGRVVEPADREEVWPGWNMVQEALRSLPNRMPNTAVTSAIDLPLVDAIHINTEGLVRLGRRLALLCQNLTGDKAISTGPILDSAELVSLPSGTRNGIRLRFGGVTGVWAKRHKVHGFFVRQTDWEQRAPLTVVNAWIEDDDEDSNRIMLLLNREPEKGTEVKIAYGLGPNPPCDLADEADMPLCAFLWRPVSN
ncbi:MAG: sialate O-acetylesterase [Spirochaetales bacterium]|jgi:sialate O-acetylesterase|nr:sialate O-acetylesterase [Spirochaetales bacterium]